MAAVTQYPWEALDALSRRALVAYRATRRQLDQAVRIAALEGAMSETTKLPVRLVVRSISARDAPAERGVSIPLEVADGSAELVVGVEPALALAVVAQVLGRAASLSAPDAGVDPSLRGALAAVLIESARRTGADLPLRWCRRRSATAAGLEVVATLLLDGRPYDASVWVVARDSTRARPAASIAELGALEVAVPLVVALSVAERGELAGLGPGDAWLPGAGWWIDSEARGRAALASPAAELGVAVDLAPDGRIVLRGESVALPTESPMTEPDDTTEQPLQEAVLDAPIVVRVELGAVSMRARDWAELRPGDVIETGHRIAEPVVLRVAGRAVARGELVRIEGELGVRIRELCTEDEA
jgi:type III secretion system YscQ/HrcQ family protein